MKNSYISLTFSNLSRAFRLFVEGYLFGSKFGRFEFRRSFLRPWLNAMGAVGAWIMWLILCTLPVVALWLALWVGYASGMKM